MAKFTVPNRNAVPDVDDRSECLKSDIVKLLDEITSIDIALSNRDYVAGTISENDAHYRLKLAADILRSIA